MVARGVNFIVGNFTAHQHLGEQTVPVQRAFDVLVEGSDEMGSVIAIGYFRSKWWARQVRIAVPMALSVE